MKKHPTLRTTKAMLLSIFLSTPFIGYSQFTSDDGIITVNNFSDLDNKEEVIMESTNQQPNFTNNTGENCAVVKVMRRSYHITFVKGDPGTMDMHFDLTAIGGYTDVNRIHLMNDFDRDGYDNDRPIAGVVNGNTLSFYGITLADNSTITLGEAIMEYYAVSSGSLTDAIWAESTGGAAANAHDFCEYVSMIIETGSNVDINQNSKHIDNLTIEAGATLNYDVNAGNKSLFIHGDMHLEGAYTTENTAIQLVGTEDQYITGTYQEIKRIRCNNPGNIYINSAGLGITEKIDISQGTVHSNGLLTIRSFADHTAYIGDLSNGDIVGDINVERFHTASTGWFMMGSPVSGNTLADWNQELITTGFTGSDYPLTSFVNIQGYDESVPGSRNNGWDPVTNVNDPIADNSGYYVYANAGDVMVVSTGTVRKGTQALAVSYSNGTSSADGFCMVANPYASAIDWNSAAWNKVNMDNVVYVYDASIGGYATYVNGVGNNGGSNIIPSSQAFFVKANAASPVLEANEAVKTTVSGDFKFFTENEVIRLSVSQDGMKDAITLVNNVNAKAEFMPKRDAERMPVMPSMLSFGAVLGDGLYAIKNLNLTENIRIPLYLHTESAEPTMISLEENSLSASTFVSLYDNLTGEMTPLNSNTKLSIDTNDEFRYELIINSSELSVTNERLEGTIVQTGNTLTFQLSAKAGAPAQINIWNSMGQLIRSGMVIQPGDQITMDISDISGQFIARMMNEQNGKNVTKNCIK